MRAALAGLALLLLGAPGGAQDASAGAEAVLAKHQFGAVRDVAPGAPRSIGSYSRGCLIGAVKLAADGPTWQGMRLSRNRHYGHPVLIDFLETLAEGAPDLGLRGLLFGDLSQPRGGPMPSGHTSHQIGLDADIWFKEMPQERLSEAAREDIPFESMVADGAVVDGRFTVPLRKLVRAAAQDRRVERIFVHPAIKKALCDWAEPGGPRGWLSKVRPWYGHDAHFHVRLKCPASQKACRGQRPPPQGDGCGKALDYWFTDEPYRPDPDARPKPPLTLARMPAACRPLVGGPPLPKARPHVASDPDTATLPAAPAGGAVQGD